MDLRKVYGGTPVGTASRCDSCSNSVIVRGFSESEKVVMCRGVYPRIHISFPVRECTAYRDHAMSHVDDLEEIAWMITPRSSGQQTGFLATGSNPSLTVRPPQGDDED